MNRHFDDYLERCPYCKRFMTPEQAKDHICNSPLIDVKEIAIIYHFETCDKNGDTLIIARGLDGVLYKLHQCKNLVRGTDVIRRKFTGDESDNNFTEPDFV